MARRRRQDARGRPHGALVLLQEPLHGRDAMLAGATDGTTRLDAMLAQIRGGTSPRTAGSNVGIPATTWTRWMREGGVAPGSLDLSPTNERAPEHIRTFWSLVERARAGYRSRVALSVTMGITRNPVEGRKILHNLEPDEPAWKPSDEAPVTAPGLTQNVERQVMVIPEGKARDILRGLLAGEAADEGEEEADLSSMREVVIPASAKRVGP